MCCVILDSVSHGHTVLIAVHTHCVGGGSGFPLSSMSSAFPEFGQSASSPELSEARHSYSMVAGAGKTPFPLQVPKFRYCGQRESYMIFDPDDMFFS